MPGVTVTVISELTGSKRETTTGQAGAAGKLSTEQRTQITSVIKETRVQPVTNVNFSISVGTRVPRDVTFHTLPERVVTIYPEWRSYKYILVKEQIVIVVTGAGELERTNKVKKIFHVAAVVGQVGKGYSPIPDITECVRNAIETADDSEFDDADLKTMLLPLLGTGTGRGELERRARELISAAISHMERHPPCRIQRVYFLSWTERDLAVCQRILQESPEVTIP